MKVSRLIIKNFRGIKAADLFLPDHVVLIGDNNVGKSTVFEALDLVLGPDRLNRRPPVDEHDFFQSLYRGQGEERPPEVHIEATITHLNSEQRNRFKDYIEWWDQNEHKLLTDPPLESVDQDHVTHALRVAFSGSYDEEEDDFMGTTYFSRSDEEGDPPQVFSKRDKQYCGFLYLRSLRTGRRALSLEHGSLLDIILRLQEIRPQMWDKTIEALAKHDVAGDPALGISGILESIETAIKTFVPREWGVAPRLKVSNLTREHLRSVITAFVGTGHGNHAVPFYRQGTGTINLIVLAMLSQIAKDKRNVVFAMEEPETAIPPYAQKRIVHEVVKISSQALFTSHSPYVLEEFTPEQTIVLSRGNDGVLSHAVVELPESVKHKRYRQEFRTRFCEGLLSRRILICEGATEASAMTAVARKLSEVDPERFSPLEALGICIVDAGTETQIADLAKLYRGLGKQVFAICDKQSPTAEATIEAEVDKLFMHGQKGFEDLVLKNTTRVAMERFIDILIWPSHLAARYPHPKTDPERALSEYFKWSKGDQGIADFLVSCTIQDVPEWIQETCVNLKALCEPKTLDSEAPGRTESAAQEGEGLA